MHLLAKGNEALLNHRAAVQVVEMKSAHHHHHLLHHHLCVSLIFKRGCGACMALMRNSLCYVGQRDRADFSPFLLSAFRECFTK